VIFMPQKLVSFPEMDAAQMFGVAAVALLFTA
jgi:hypothetical protein